MEIHHDLDGVRIIGTEDEMALWKTDPVAFIEKLYGPLEDWQKEIIREEIHTAAMEMCGFSICGSAPTGDPDNYTFESVQIVRKDDEIRAACKIGGLEKAMIDLGTLVQPRKVIEPEEWMYAKPQPEERGRQLFKHVANKSSWSRHDGRKRRHKR